MKKVFLLSFLIAVAGGRQGIPLPSEPEVKKGDVETFRRAHTLMSRKLRRALPRQGFQVGEIAGRGPAGQVTFHEKIGAHDITVTYFLDSAGFIRWVEDTLRAAGATTPRMPEPLKPVIAVYLREGFQWFVFNVVCLDTRPKTIEAIQFRFTSRFLYFPLKVTRTAAVQTNTDLLMLLLSFTRNWNFPSCALTTDDGGRSNEQETQELQCRGKGCHS